MRKKINIILYFILINLYCLIFRFIPFKIANLEPVLSIQATLNKQFGTLFLLLFGFSNIVIFDLLSFKFGIWTLVTATTFASLPLMFRLLNKIGVVNNIVITIIGTLFFDITTCLIGPVWYQQSFAEAIIGQIPFSIIHLTGNIIFSLIFNVLQIIYKEKTKKITYFKA